MTKDQLGRLYHRASVCAERLTLPLRSQVWRGMAGEFQGAGTGSSIDFQDHRAYVPGDDPRHINWQAYARTGSYSMKLYREEVRPVIDVILDASESMFFEPSKAARTAELFYFAIISAIQAGASTRVHILRGDSYQELPMDAITSHLWFDKIKNHSSQNPSSPLALNKVPMRGNAIRLLISDLLFEGDPNPQLRLLSHQQGKGILLVPFLQSEAQPEWEGNYEFIDAESTSQHPHRIEKSTLRNYKNAYAQHFTQWHSAARQFNTPLARVNAHTDLLTALNEEAVSAGALTIS